MVTNCFPNEPFDWMKYYKEGLIFYLEGTKHGHTCENARKFLRKIDNILEVYSKGPIDEISFIDLYEINEETPSKIDISFNLLNFLIERVGKDRKVDTTGRKECFNIIKDFKRVTSRALNGEPLYLIPEQYISFKKFVHSLRSHNHYDYF